MKTKVNEQILYSPEYNVSVIKKTCGKISRAEWDYQQIVEIRREFFSCFSCIDHDVDPFILIEDWICICKL